MNRQAAVAVSVLLLLAGVGVALSTGSSRPARVIAAETAPAVASPARQPTSDVVLWLSLDGLRSDYLSRANAPHLQRLMREGVYSLELEPIFPAITFPSHVSQATGVRVARHGIPSNTFYDSAAERVYAYPAFGNLLGAEPIWLTAARQNVRVAALDWPLSNGQRGKIKAAYCEPKFDTSKTDAERLDRILEVWQGDEAEEPLRLLMGYVVGTDKVGHERGPDSREVIDAMQELDALLGAFIERVVKVFDAQRRGDEQLYVLLTTDHGMSPVHTLVHLGHLASVEGDEGVKLSTGGNVGDIFFKSDLPDRETAIEAALVEIRQQPFARAWKRDELPAEWELNHPTRVGDVVVVLDRGYTFTRTPKGITMPVTERGPYGMHGYDPKHNPDMLGPLIVWRYPQPLPPRQLGRVHALQLHPTVTKLLNIEPAEFATGEPLTLEP